MRSEAEWVASIAAPAVVLAVAATAILAQGGAGDVVFLVLGPAFIAGVPIGFGLVVSFHARWHTYYRLRNLRPLPGPRLVVRAEARPPRPAVPQMVQAGYTSSALAIVCCLLSRMAQGRSSIMAVVELLSVVVTFAAVANSLASVGLAVGLHRVAAGWAQREDEWGVLLVREATPLRTSQVAVGVAPPLRRPPPIEAAAMGVGWYWVPLDQVHGNQVGVTPVA